jgi:hypothetical protein
VSGCCTQACELRHHGGDGGHHGAAPSPRRRSTWPRGWHAGPGPTRTATRPAGAGVMGPRPCRAVSASPAPPPPPRPPVRLAGRARAALRVVSKQRPKAQRCGQTRSAPSAVRSPAVRERPRHRVPGQGLKKTPREGGREREKRERGGGGSELAQALSRAKRRRPSRTWPRRRGPEAGRAEAR